MRVALFRELGNPSDVVRIEDRESPSPAAGQLLVRVRYAPIHPAEINYIQGTYGVRPDLPAIPGSEAAGVVEAVGEGLEDAFSPGDKVALLGRMGSWRDFLVLTPDHVFKLPEGLDLRQACMLVINPVTALRLLEGPLSLAPGEWVLQNVANSAVGRCVIQIARARGIRTLNLVRRESLIPELEGLGADAVLLDEPDSVERAAALLKGQPPLRLALNAVGADSAQRQMDMLSEDGTLVTYGAMSRRSLTVPNKHLIFRNLKLEGLWVSRWFQRAAKSEVVSALNEVARLMIEGRLEIPVHACYSLERVSEALAAAQEEGRSGKILIEF